MRAEIVNDATVLDMRGTLGRGGGFGRVTFGYNWFGFYSKYFGIYSRKYYYGEAYISKMKFYRPTNPQTIVQQAWRSVFADGKSAWGVLNAQTKEIYRKKGMKLKMTGMNAYLSEYLKEHRI